MKANLFSTLFENFTLEERQKFRLFLISPYFNKSGPVTRLFEIHAAHQGEMYDHEIIWGLLYPGKQFAANQLRKHYSDLHQLARKFLMVEELSNSARTSSLLLLKRFRSTISPARLRREIAYAQDEFTHDAPEYPDIDSYSYASQLHAYSYFLDVHERKVVPSLGQAITSLDAAFLLSKLKFLCEISSIRNVFQYEFEFLFESEILEAAAKPPFSEYLLIKIFLRILGLFRGHHQHTAKQAQGSPKLSQDYDRLVEIVTQSYSKISMDELQTIQNFLQNFCIQRIASADQAYEEKLNALYEFRLENGSIFINGWLRAEDYKNRTSLLLKLKQFPQAQDFIQKYAERVLPEFRENAKHFNLGNYFYHMGDFSKMRKELIVILNHDTFYLLDSKALMIKAYFLEQDIDALKLQLDSLKTYLRRNSKLPSDRISRHVNRYRFFEKFFRLLEKKVPRPERLEKLRDEIEACHPLLDRHFFLELLEKWKKAGLQK
jgi:hypothetical protein